MKMIILEGSDCVGKTTLAMELRRLLPGWSYRYHTRPPENVPVWKYHGWSISDAHPRMIVDRLHWSDYAYGSTYRSGLGYSSHEWRKIELLLLARNARVLYLHDEPDRIRERWNASQQMFDSGPLNTLLGHYADLVSTNISKLPRTCGKLTDYWNLREKTPTPLMRDLARELEAEADRTDALLPSSVGCGNPEPVFVILGESPRDQQGCASDDPQVPLGKGPACDLLWQALDDQGVMWWHGYYTNVSAFHSHMSLGNYFSGVVRPRAIVCLGSKAQEVVNLARSTGNLSPAIRVETVKHPSYIQRFGDYARVCQWKVELKRAIMGE